MEWYSGSIPDAVGEAKRNNKLFLVYIEGEKRFTYLNNSKLTLGYSGM